jgi:hypothetical protein
MEDVGIEGGPKRRVFARAADWPRLVPLATRREGGARRARGVPWSICHRGYEWTGMPMQPLEQAYGRAINVDSLASVHSNYVALGRLDKPAAS